MWNQCRTMTFLKMSLMMRTSQKIDFKDPRWAITWLSAALRKEQDKYEQCPIQPDLVPGHETAQGWGYVVAGYFLIEESFKVVLHLRNKQVPAKHSLTMLFELFESTDQDEDVLREYYSDYRATIGGSRANLPFATLDEFLKNLDGDLNQRGSDYIGSFDWRYFPIEERRSQDMPLVSIDYLHEVSRGCINIANYIYRGNIDPRHETHSWRMRHSRIEKYHAWLMVRRKKSDGWDELPDRLEILWGPDYRGRHDLFLCKGAVVKLWFSELPENCPLPIIDRREEVEEYDVEAGWQSIGVITS